MTMNDAKSHLAQRVGKQLVDWYSDLRVRHEDERAWSTLIRKAAGSWPPIATSTSTTLWKWCAAVPHGADEMIEMLKALLIDPADLQAHLPDLFRDLQVTCATCQDKGRAGTTLKDGTAPVKLCDYCANAPALNVMRAEPPLLRE